MKKLISATIIFLMLCAFLQIPTIKRAESTELNPIAIQELIETLLKKIPKKCFEFGREPSDSDRYWQDGLRQIRQALMGYSNIGYTNPKVLAAMADLLKNTAILIQVYFSGGEVEVNPLESLQREPGTYDVGDYKINHRFPGDENNFPDDNDNDCPKRFLQLKKEIVEEFADDLKEIDHGNEDPDFDPENWSQEDLDFLDKLLPGGKDSRYPEDVPGLPEDSDPGHDPLERTIRDRNPYAVPGYPANQRLELIKRIIPNLSEAFRQTDTSYNASVTTGILAATASLLYLGGRFVIKRATTPLRLLLTSSAVGLTTTAVMARGELPVELDDLACFLAEETSETKYELEFFAQMEATESGIIAYDQAILNLLANNRQNLKAPNIDIVNLFYARQYLMRRLKSLRNSRHLDQTQKNVLNFLEKIIAEQSATPQFSEEEKEKYYPALRLIYGPQTYNKFAARGREICQKKGPTSVDPLKK